jgi:hypothetical protein
MGMRNLIAFRFFTVFKDLVSKMLNPSRSHRLKIQEVEQHPWILGVFVEEFPQIDDRWKHDTIKKYAESNNFSEQSVEEQLLQNPFGPLGGMYNIEKHQYQISKIMFRKAPSCCKIRDIKVINQIFDQIHHKLALQRVFQNHPEASSIHRPTTSNNEVLLDDVAKSRQRPKTSHAHTGTLKLLATKLRSNYGCD